MDKTIQEEIAEFIVQLNFDNIKEPFVKDIKYRIMDWFGCAVTGIQYPQSKIVRNFFLQMGGKEEASVFGTNIKMPAPNAAFVNGIIGHVSELDDGHRKAIGHPASITVPVALALTEKQNTSGKDFLKAILVGYEVFIRLGATVNPPQYKYWHTTSTCGIFAATAVAAVILKLTITEIVDALGIASTMASGLVDSFGSYAKSLNIGHACQSGIIAASLSKAGFTGSPTGMDGKKGIITATCPSPNWDMLKFSADNLVTNTAFYKVYASCGHTNSPLDIIFELLNQDNIMFENVDNVLVETYKVSVDITKDFKNTNENEAKFSLPYCIAVALKYKQVTLHEFTEQVLNDPDIVQLGKKIKVIESQQATQQFPRRGAKVTVILKNGKVISKEVEDAHDVANYEKLENKFYGLVGKHNYVSAKKMLDGLKSLECQSGTSVLVDFLQVCRCQVKL